MWRDYLFARSVGEAVELLARHEGKARLIAGGTDLVLQCQRGECSAEVLVDVTRIPGMAHIEEQDGSILLGAAVTHTQAASSALLRLKAPLLSEACHVIGGPQVRNLGTLAGNLVAALPAADASLALVALDGEAEIASPEGRRWVPLSDFHTGVGLCRLDPTREVMTTLRFRAFGPEYRAAQERLARRKVHALPIMNVAVLAAVREGRFADVRIVVAPVAPTPLRLRRCEELLEGREATPEAIREAADLAVSLVHPRDSLLRGSGEYRQALAGVMVRRALERVAGIAPADRAAA